MRNCLLVLACSGVLGIGFAQRGMRDYTGAGDPALLSRLPGFYLPSAGSVIDKKSGTYQFFVKGEKHAERKQVKGHSVTYNYVFDRSRGASPGSLQIMHSYQEAAGALGGKVMYQDPYRTTLVISKDGQETWIEVAPAVGGYDYTLRIVEPQTMQESAPPANTAFFQTALARQGHVEVQGIFFDTAGSDLKPDSEPALKEIVKFLEDNPGLKVWVVAHTDNAGEEATDIALSQARAASVVKALIGMGISPARLAPRGAGPFAPVAPNTTESGRSKNRRIELVARQ